jgi:hypothetical protein
MSTSRSHRRTLSSRRLLVRATAVALFALMALPLGAVAQEEQGADPAGSASDPEGMGGYNVNASGAPVSMLVYEPVFPIPVDPGEPHMEGTLSYTATRLANGPQARALSSSIWPGTAFGDGFATICECDEDWFVRADARYPDGEQEVEQALPTGGGMRAAANGVDVVSTAQAGESPNEEAMVYGDMRSRSTSTVEDAVAIATADSRVQEISLLGGVITIESVRTKLTATSDMASAATEGRTKIDGLVIGGYGYAVDEDGLRPVEEDEPQEGIVPLPSEEAPGEAELSEHLGIEVELVPHEEEITDADARRKAGGLRVSIDTATIKDSAQWNDIVGALPPELAVHFAAVLALGPQIDFVFGRAEVHAAATEPIDLDFDLDDLGDLAMDDADMGDLAAGDAAFDEGGFDEPMAADVENGFGDEGGDVASPEVAGEGKAMEAGAGLPDLFGGLPASIVALGLVLAAGAAYGLTTVSAMAMSGAGGPSCDAGAAKRIPNLRALD